MAQVRALYRSLLRAAKPYDAPRATWKRVLLLTQPVVRQHVQKLSAAEPAATHASLSPAAMQYFLHNPDYVASQSAVTGAYYGTSQRFHPEPVAAQNNMAVEEVKELAECHPPSTTEIVGFVFRDYLANISPDAAPQQRAQHMDVAFTALRTLHKWNVTLTDATMLQLTDVGAIVVALVVRVVFCLVSCLLDHSKYTQSVLCNSWQPQSGWHKRTTGAQRKKWTFPMFARCSTKSSS